MILDGLVLACITGVAFWMLYAKLPRKMRKFLQKHILFTDTISCLLTYALFGGTLVALFAAAWLSVIISALLLMMRNPSVVVATDQLLFIFKGYRDQVSKWITEKFPPEKEINEEETLEQVLVSER